MISYPDMVSKTIAQMTVLYILVSFPSNKNHFSIGN